MRILVDYRPALRERTGVGEYVHELARALSAPQAEAWNDQIVLFTSSWKDRSAPALASEMPASVRVVDVKVPVRALVWSWNRLEWPPVEWLAGSSDVVHSQSPLLIPASRAAQVVTVHDLDFLRHPDQMTAEIRRDYPTLARAHAARAHGVIVSSQYAAGEVTRELQLDPSRVHVCPPGRPSWSDEVRKRRQSPGHPGRGEGGHVLFMGTLSLRKNVGTLLEAYAQLRTRVKDAPPLVLAGHRTPASARWEARCEQPPLKGHVQITGYVDTATRIDLYEKATMLVLPSYEEGFGLPVLEAMACGTPVIASEVGGLAYLVRDGETGFTIPDQEPDTLCEKISWLLNDHDMHARMSARAVEYAQDYAWDKIANQIITVYQDLLKREKVSDALTISDRHL